MDITTSDDAGPADGQPLALTTVYDAVLTVCSALTSDHPARRPMMVADPSHGAHARFGLAMFITSFPPLMEGEMSVVCEG